VVLSAAPYCLTFAQNICSYDMHTTNTTTIHRCSGNIELKKVDGQWGVYTSRSYTKGSTVISSKAQSTSNLSCSHSIQTDWNKYTLMNLPARFLNHCCGPNIGVRGDGLNSSDSYDFVALRDIEKGEVRNRCIHFV